MALAPAVQKTLLRPPRTLGGLAVDTLALPMSPPVQPSTLGASVSMTVLDPTLSVFLLSTYHISDIYPGTYYRKLLDYLDDQDIKATFFVVGSRVIERPSVLVEEYMSGHEISVHTWSHRLLTTLTNEQIVAELAFTREAIKRVLGVTPTTMRPPQGDIGMFPVLCTYRESQALIPASTDDRVRAISLALGLVPIMWSSTPSAGKFDTNDWQVAAGMVTGEQSFNTFQGILGNASLLDTG